MRLDLGLSALRLATVQVTDPRGGWTAGKSFLLSDADVRAVERMQRERDQGHANGYGSVGST